MFVQVRAQVDVKALIANHRERGGRAFDWIEQRLGSELGLDQSESAAQGKILEWSEVEHGRDCVGDATGFKKFWNEGNKALSPALLRMTGLQRAGVGMKLCPMTN
jgi:hypothetical protein